MAYMIVSSHIVGIVKHVGNIVIKTSSRICRDIITSTCQKRIFITNTYYQKEKMLSMCEKVCMYSIPIDQLTDSEFLIENEGFVTVW
jgi:hypothetical protein